ncbi:MAG: dephospho-CoA kinase [Mariprofundales bacterium]
MCSYQFNSKLPVLVAITGGIGSGKSLATSIFAEAGVATLDLDKVGRELTAIGSPVLAQLQQSFGDDIVRQDGSLNRFLLAQRSFADAYHTGILGNILHPLIWQKVHDWQQQQLKYCQQPQRLWILVEASTLIESSSKKQVAYLLVIMADLAIRRQRVQQRGHPALELFSDIVQRQCNDNIRLASADFIINNNDSLSALSQQIQQCISVLDARFSMTNKARPASFANSAC